MVAMESRIVFVTRKKFSRSSIQIVPSQAAMTASGGGEASPLVKYVDVMQYVKPGKPQNSKLIEVITGAGEKSMPPSPYPALTSDQITLITQWIQQGAGYNVDCGVTVHAIHRTSRTLKRYFPSCKTIVTVVTAVQEPAEESYSIRISLLKIK